CRCMFAMHYQTRKSHHESCPIALNYRADVTPSTEEELRTELELLRTRHQLVLQLLNKGQQRQSSIPASKLKDPRSKKHRADKLYAAIMSITQERELKDALSFIFDRFSKETVHALMTNSIPFRDNL